MMMFGIVITIILFAIVNSLYYPNRYYRTRTVTIKTLFKDFLESSKNKSSQSFTNSIEYEISHNTKIRIEGYTDFLKRNPQIPNIQREYDEDRVKEFYDHITAYRGKPANKKHLDRYPVPFFGPLGIGYYKNNSLILDGQHRFLAYKQYYTEVLDQNDKTDATFNITYMERICNSRDDLKQYFVDLNNNFNSTAIIIIENELDAKDAIKAHILSKYKKHVSNAAKPRYPNVNLDQVVRYFLDKHGVKDSKGILNYDKIINTLEDINSDLRDKFKVTDLNIFDETEKKGGLYLAYLLSDADDKGRKKLPQKVRTKVWNKFFNHEDFSGKCTVCEDPITKDDYQCGHITAVAKGGTNNLNNLAPVCGSCNRSMMTENMDEYRKKFFSK